VLGDHRLHSLQIGVDELEVLTWRHRFGKGRKISHVREENGHLLLKALAESDIDNAVLAEELQELMRDKTAVRGDYVVKRMVVHRIVHPSY
jgi:hypothetical protein